MYVPDRETKTNYCIILDCTVIKLQRITENKPLGIVCSLTEYKNQVAVLKYEGPLQASRVTGSSGGKHVCYLKVTHAKSRDNKYESSALYSSVHRNCWSRDRQTHKRVASSKTSQEAHKNQQFMTMQISQICPLYMKTQTMLQWTFLS